MSTPRYRRSRNGCVRCKQRKVRCGEQKPICTACDRLNLSCEYSSTKPLLARDGKSSPSKQSGSVRSRYLIRFVDCNRNASSQSKDSHRADKALGIDQDHSTPCAMDDLPATTEVRASISLEKDINQKDYYDDPPDQTSFEEHGSTSTQDAQSLDQLMMHEFLIKPSTEGDLDPLLSYDLSAQLFDALDQNLWETPFNPDFELLADGDIDAEIYPDPIMADENISEQSPQVASSPSITSSISSRSNKENNVQIRDGDHSLIQHFLTAMKQYTSKLLQSSEEDINCLTFSNLGLFNEQLFQSMMAFAALHRAYTQDSFFTEAELRYQRATALLYEDENPHEHLDVTISTVWFLLQYELLYAKGTARFCNLLAHLSHILDGYTLRHSEDPECISKLGARTLCWLAAYDVRALSSGGQGGYLLRSLETFLPIRVLLEEPIHTWHGGHLACLMDSLPTSLQLDHAALLRLRLRCNLLHGRILLLSPPDRSQTNQPMSYDQRAEWNSIRALLKEQHDVFEGHSDKIGRFSYDIATGKTIHLAGKMSSIRFNRLLALSSLYAAVIDYDQAITSMTFTDNSLPETPTSFLSSTNLSMPKRLFPEGECAARIVRIAWFVRQNRCTSPQSVWPSLLMAAGFDSIDGVHREWLLNALKEAESWSAHFLNSRILLGAVYDYQSKLQQTGTTINILKIQAQTTGSFIL